MFCFIVKKSKVEQNNERCIDSENVNLTSSTIAQIHNSFKS